MEEVPQWIKDCGIKTEEDMNKETELQSNLLMKCCTHERYGKGDLIKEIAALDMSVEYKLFLMMNLQHDLDGFESFLERVKQDPGEVIKQLVSAAKERGIELPPLPKVLEDAMTPRDHVTDVPMYQ